MQTGMERYRFVHPARHRRQPPSRARAWFRAL